MGEALAGIDWAPVGLTLRLATASTVILLLIGTPLALWLAFTRSKIKPVVEAVTALPLVLPPTVLGFYLLILLAPNGVIGRMWEAAGGARLVFSFGGLLIGSVLYSLPFVVQPIQSSFQLIDRRLLDVAATLGASPVDRFASILVPLSRSGFVTAAVLGFAHTVGEFGVVLMIGGNIPAKTQVLSIAIYDHVEVTDYASAHVLSAAMLLFSFVVLVGIYAFNRRIDVVRLGSWRR